MRDLVKLEDWDGELSDIQAAEKVVEADSIQYNTNASRIRLGEIAEMAKSHNAKLDSIGAAIREQIRQQERMQETSEYRNCSRDLCLIDPREDMRNLKNTKGLLKDAYRWVLDHPDFRQWRDDAQTRVLWVKADPGKGKTMLLCGIIDELQESLGSTGVLSYFFCQAGEPSNNNATAVLRGLLFMLIKQQPLLVSHVREKYDCSGKAIFEDKNAWSTLEQIFANVLQDPSLRMDYLIIDALDECHMDRKKLLDFVAKHSSTSSQVKWIVSSRNWLDIEEKLEPVGHKVKLSLELKENASQVSRAVDAYIDHCLHGLPKFQNNNLLRELVRGTMHQKASGTFLWVSLVVEELKGDHVMAWEVPKLLENMPTDLRDVYRRMVEQIEGLPREYPGLCRQVLSTIIAAYRPLHLQELHLLSGLPTEFQEVDEVTTGIVKKCGSFLTIQEGSVYIIHQSARDFLSDEASYNIFPCGIKDVHYSIISKSLQAMSTTLRRDMYSLRAPGYPAEQVELPDPDPLAASRYSCIYWIDHLCDWSLSSSANSSVDLRDGGVVHEFVAKKYLYWLEALSLCKSMSAGVISMARLEALVQGRADAAALMRLVQDAHRFILYHKGAIENSPLQTYTTALLFSPTGSLIRRLFQHEEPEWISIKPVMGDNWSACLQTLEGHSDWVRSVAFSHDSTWLVSGSDDKTVKIWDASSGACLQTLEGHGNIVSSVTFSHDSTRLASASWDTTVKIWDVSNGACLQTLEGHSETITSVAFSYDSARLASASRDKTVKIWDARNGLCLQTLEGHRYDINSVAFSHDSTQLASASLDIVKIWDAHSGACLQTLEGHNGDVNSVAFSHDSTWLISGSDDKTVKIWDASSGACLQTLEGHNGYVSSVAFSHDSTRLASASYDSTVKIWDASSGACLQTLEGHSDLVNSVTFSHDLTQLASASQDETVKIWDANSNACLQTLDSHSNTVTSSAFSHDSTKLASASRDKTVKIWDASSGACLQTLEGHSDGVSSVTFSHDLTQLASASKDDTAKIWDVSSGACLQTLEGCEYDVNSVAFSHDSTRLASASCDDTVKIWDASSGACLQTLEGHSDLVISVAFSHDSTRLASASRDDTVKMWNASSGACLQTLEGHSDGVSSVAFSHNSTRLASASRDKTVKIWDASSGACLQTLNIGKALYDLSFDPISSRLHTETGTIVIQSLEDSSVRDVSELERPLYVGTSVSLDRMWIQYDGNNMLWVPSEYRPSCTSVSGTIAGVGTGSGRVWFCCITP